MSLLGAIISPFKTLWVSMALVIGLAGLTLADTVVSKRHAVVRFVEGGGASVADLPLALLDSVAG